MATICGDPVGCSRDIRLVHTQVESRDCRRHYDDEAHCQMQTSMVAASGSTIGENEPAQESPPWQLGVIS